MKKGFLVWSDVMSHTNSSPESTKQTLVGNINPNVPTGLSMLLANILTERGEKNGRVENPK